MTPDIDPRIESNPSPITLECQPEELVYMATQLGAATVVGVPDPFRGFLVEEIKEAVQAANNSLKERNLISNGVKGSTSLDSTAAVLVGALAYSTGTFLATSTCPGQPARTRLWAVRAPTMLEVNLTNEGKYRLEALPDLETIISRILAFWEVACQKPVNSPPGSIPQIAFLEACELASAGSTQQAIEQLYLGGLSLHTAESLVDSLIRPLHNGSFIMLRHDHSGWNENTLGMLEGANGLWILRSYQQNTDIRVQIIPGTPQQLAEELVKSAVDVLGEQPILEGMYGTH